MTDIGSKVQCVLCGGDGYVSHETARYYGRSEGDSTCPECDGTGRTPYNPLCSHPPCMGLAKCNTCRMCGTHCKCLTTTRNSPRQLPPKRTKK